MMKIVNNKNLLIVTLLTIIGAFFHFYNLNWGAPYYFHPDERNIAASVSQLQFPNQMHPHFFAYGSLPIYLMYFTGLLVNLLTTNHQPLSTNFELALQISRFYSALFATLLIPILFFIGKKMKNETTGLIAAFLTTTSVGFIQFAHFGTFEMWLTFFGVLLFWQCIQPLTKKTFLSIGIILGMLIAIKVSSLALLPIILLLFFLKPLASSKGTVRKKIFYGLRFVGVAFIEIIFILWTASLVYVFTNPFVFIDTKSFLDSMDYESTLALGTLLVFYTGEFFDTLPVIFHFINVYPFLLNPLITLLFIPSFLFVCFITFKKKDIPSILLLAFFVILFLSQAILFVKWTRYMVPTLPFIYLLIAIALSEIKNKTIKQWSNGTLVLISIIFAFSYFVTVFIKPDTRVDAYRFALKTIPYHAPILSEIYDMGIVPFNDAFRNITLFHFYDLDNNSPEATPEALQKQLARNAYIILPSQRILKTRLLHKDRFPQANEFYQELFDGSLGYQKIYETPCDIFCKITYLGDPIFRFEQTANVFDHPPIMIFKKL